MKDEIIDLLQYLKNVYESEETSTWLNKLQIKDLLDYITNLQREVRVNNDLIPYFKNKEKELKKKITNLQEENKELREDNFAYHQLMKMQNKREYRSKFLKDFQKEHGKNVFPDYDEIYKRYDNYKTRNKLAIEYINKNYDTDIEDVFELLEILQGKSDE